MISLPVIEYAKALNTDHDALLRALAFANLVAIQQKMLIGCLSAFCGAISAGCASGAGIAYLLGGDLHLINHTIVNCLAILPCTICDGAKPSCAAKIASAVEARPMGYQLRARANNSSVGKALSRKE